MPKRTQIAQRAIAELYAILASAAAQRAVKQVVDWGATEKADCLAESAIKWIDKSNAEAMRWTLLSGAGPTCHD